VAAGEDSGSIAKSAAEEALRLQPGLSVAPWAGPGPEDPRAVLIGLSFEAHLLVLGSRGRGSLKSMLLGSVSSTVSAHAGCPIVVCRPTLEGQATRGVLVGADGTPESLPVIEFAYRHAALHRLPLTVLHCYWDAAAVAAAVHSGRVSTPEDGALEDLRAVLAESVAGLSAQYPDVPVTLGIRHGLVDAVLTSPAETWDLIVVGRHPMTTLAHVFTGSIATTLVERAHSTVAVVPEAPPTP
jgi:nucleotide-binding universal stress UspA family protein